MEPWFGVIAGGTAGPLQTKKEVAFGEFNAPRQPQHSIFHTEWHEQK